MCPAKQPRTPRRKIGGGNKKDSRGKRARKAKLGLVFRLLDSALPDNRLLTRAAPIRATTVREWFPQKEIEPHGQSTNDGIPQ